MYADEKPIFFQMGSVWLCPGLDEILLRDNNSYCAGDI